MYTQSLFVLCHDSLSADELGARLRRMNVLGRQTPPVGEHWARNAPGWVTQYAGHPRGRAVIDTISCPWPDQFNREQDHSIHAAWSMGLLGNDITPGALERAGMSATESLRVAVDNHTGFVRLRMSYVPESDMPLIPPERSPYEELAYLTRAAYFILEDDAAFALFVPAADRVHGDRKVWMTFDRAFGDAHKMTRLWTGPRYHSLDEGTSMVELLGYRALGLGSSCLRFDERVVSRKEAFAASARLTDHLAQSPAVTEFTDAQNRVWTAEVQEGGASSVTWCVS